MTTRSFTSNPLPHALIIAGVLPFVTGAVLLLSGVNSVPLLGSVVAATATYGLVITVFLTGIHWGQQLSLGQAAPGLFVSSNIIAVSVWLLWLFLSPRLFMVMLTIPMTILLFIDFKLKQNNVIGFHYLRSRAVITAVAIASLILSATSS